MGDRIFPKGRRKLTVQEKSGNAVIDVENSTFGNTVMRMFMWRSELDPNGVGVQFI